LVAAGFASFGVCLASVLGVVGFWASEVVNRAAQSNALEVMPFA